MDWGACSCSHRLTVIYGFSEYVEYPAKGRFAHWHADGGSGIYDGPLARKPVGSIHGDRADNSPAEMLLYLEHYGFPDRFYRKRIVNLWKILILVAEIYIHHRPYYFLYLSLFHNLFLIIL